MDFQYFIDIIAYIFFAVAIILLFLRTITDIKHQIYIDNLTPLELFIEYDREHNKNKNAEICEMFKRLGYYNIVISKTQSLNDDDINYRLKRSIELSKHLINKTTNAFYHSLNKKEQEIIFKIKNKDTYATDGKTFYV
jgi:hypothetical protein